VLLQKLLLLHPYCPRLWLRLGQIMMDTCRRFQCQSCESTASSLLDHNGHTNSSASPTSYSAEGHNILCNGLSDVTTPAVTDVDCISCSSSILSVDNGRMLEFNIPTCIIQSMTCFVATM